MADFTLGIVILGSGILLRSLASLMTVAASADMKYRKDDGSLRLFSRGKLEATSEYYFLIDKNKKNTAFFLAKRTHVVSKNRPHS